jgi:hypothetical protein
MLLIMGKHLLSALVAALGQALALVTLLSKSRMINEGGLS